MKIWVYVPKIEMEIDVPEEVLQHPEGSAYRDIALDRLVYDKVACFIDKGEVEDEHIH